MNDRIPDQKDKMPPKRPLNLVVEREKKRCRKSVSLGTKLEVLRRIEASQKIVQICRSLGLAKSTVQTIRDNRDKIILYSQSAASLSVSKLTRQRSSIMEKMEKLLAMWIEDSNQRRMPISTTMIQEKAKSIFQNLKSEDSDEASEDATFLASRGWFEKFKNRHNLRKTRVNGEAADAAQEGPYILERIVESCECFPEQAFNVDETGAYWERLPERTCVSQNNKCEARIKETKEVASAEKDFTLKPPSFAGVEGEGLGAEGDHLSSEEFIKLEPEQTLYEGPEEPEPAPCQNFAINALSKALYHFDQGISILLQTDPNEERSAEVSRSVNAAIDCYREVHRDAKGRDLKQLTLDQFFKPRPCAINDSSLVLCKYSDSE